MSAQTLLNFRTLMLGMSRDTLLSFCGANGISTTISQDDSFWEERVRKEIGEVQLPIRPEDVSWRQVWNALPRTVTITLKTAARIYKETDVHGLADFSDLHAYSFVIDSDIQALHTAIEGTNAFISQHGLRVGSSTYSVDEVLYSVHSDGCQVKLTLILFEEGQYSTGEFSSVYTACFTERLSELLADRPDACDENSEVMYISSLTPVHSPTDDDNGVYSNPKQYLVPHLYV